MQKASTVAAPRTRERDLSFSLRSLLRFRYVAVLTVLATYGLIVLGGAVRATDSGTACPDWPLCHGQVVPPFETKVMIEYSHRLAASVVGLLILGTVVWAWRRAPADRLILRAAVAAGVLLGAQILVGAATVNTETDATVVAVHLSIALTLFATLILITVHAFAERTASPPVPARSYTLPVLTALATFALIITGAYVSQTGAGLAYPDWPLFNGRLVSAGGKLADLHYAHRLVAAMVGVLLGAVVAGTLRRERDQVVMMAVTAAVALYVAQVFAGASNIWLELATWVRIVHLALASALWGVLVFNLAWPFLRARAPDTGST